MVSARFADAVARIDAAHAEDPARTPDGRAKELVYAERMSARLGQFMPEASEALRLAARCQHIRRWAIRRADYAEGTAGYRQWRSDEAAAHARAAAEILAAAGYEAEVIARVQALLRKEKLKADAEVQALEDVICLVFLEHEIADFARKHEEARVVDILRKTWRKMSARGQEAALALPLAAPVRAMVAKALEAPA
jgi:hypothetical protein